MIIDSHLILFEGAVSTTTGAAIALTSLQCPGKVEPVLITTRFTENLAGATSVTLTLQQADSQTGTFSDVTGAQMTVPAADFVVGKRTGWRFLPRSVEKPWLRLKVAVTGSPTAGKLFCALSGFEDEPYEEVQMVG